MCGVGLTVLLCLYYVNCGSGCSSPNGTADTLQRHNVDALISVGRSANDDVDENNHSNNGKASRAAILMEKKVRERVQCLPLEKNDADVNTIEVFKGFDFQVSENTCCSEVRVNSGSVANLNVKMSL